MNCTHGDFYDALMRTVLAAIADRDGATTPAAAVADALIEHARSAQLSCDQADEHNSSLSPRWQVFEDLVADQLAHESGRPATTAMRLRAIALVGLVRCAIASELWAGAGTGDRESVDRFARWVRDVARVVAR
jgi:hypothetical protein